MFPLDFPLTILDQYRPERVLDPFCGRGTTLYAARLRQVRAVGIDNNPVAVAVAQAKVARSTPAALTRLARRLLCEHSDAEPPAGPFWEACYHPTTLRQLAAVREGLLREPDNNTSILLRALLLGVLHGPTNKHAPTYLSNQMPRTFASKPAYSVRYWQEQGMKPPEVDLIDAVDRRARHTLAELPPAMSGSRVIEGDAASVLRSGRGRRFDLVITSPPYFGMRTYGPDQWLRAWFLGGSTDVDYSAPGPLASDDEHVFTAALAEVWLAAARRCRKGASLIIRFGALPSKGNDPEQLLLRSLRESRAGWLVTDVRPTPAPSAQRRQAHQFLRRSRKASQTIAEVDVTAELICSPRR
jgi:SAM-dependent methyltransferase